MGESATKTVTAEGTERGAVTICRDNGFKRTYSGNTRATTTVPDEAARARARQVAPIRKSEQATSATLALLATAVAVRIPVKSDIFTVLFNKPAAAK